ncbi:S-adenosylmethionine:tRNA ribosyltransferase-isomerase [Candidatus Sumerlaeota bacterium]|nr:S-adenosylmethionine:tRNA ribosyltransferase-isomerase [Candidatus Sumerlaeota bacterium]
MRTEDFDYSLPDNLIAPHPAERRDASRLMVLNRASGAVEHRLFSGLPNLLRPGDCLVLNESRVIPARLRGRRRSGGQAELLLLSPLGDGRWRALAKPGRKLTPGTIVRFASTGDEDGAEIQIEASLAEGERIVRAESGGTIESILSRYGEMPLPPYILAARRTSARKKIHAHPEDESDGMLPEDMAENSERDAEADRERYQTVYARIPGSVAAPTAGLHFTEELLAGLQNMGVEIRRVALHVGPGTFAPVKAADPSTHPMHREPFSVSRQNADAIQSAIDDPSRRVIAVGTTVVRVLESLMRDNGRMIGGDFSTNLLILPGFEFRAVDAMITNFHLPRSTLLMLVSAFAGREQILNVYTEAVRLDYRFYSYGDAMLIL